MSCVLLLVFVCVVCVSGVGISVLDVSAHYVNVVGVSGVGILVLDVSVLDVSCC